MSPWIIFQAHAEAGKRADQTKLNPSVTDLRTHLHALLAGTTACCVLRADGFRLVVLVDEHPLPQNEREYGACVLVLPGSKRHSFASGI